MQKKLDQHTIHGQKLSLRPFHPAGDKGAAPVGVSADGEAGALKSISDLSQMRGQAKRNNRLIIRNLSFKATEEDLKVSCPFYPFFLDPVFKGECNTTVNLCRSPFRTAHRHTAECLVRFRPGVGS